MTRIKTDFSFRGSRITFVNAMEIERSFSQRELVAVPEEILHNIAWRDLDLSRNSISSLQNQFGNLLNLKVR